MPTMKGGKVMKILKVKDNNGYFRVSDSDKWRPIDEIDKDELMNLLDCFLNSDVEMDDIEEKSLSNQAQRIIYRSIFEKLNNLKENKSKFKDESERMYLSEIQKYSQS